MINSWLRTCINVSVFSIDTATSLSGDAKGLGGLKPTEPDLRCSKTGVVCVWGDERESISNLISLFRQQVNVNCQTERNVEIKYDKDSRKIKK